MESNNDFREKSMDDIVFEKRNKSYGAYFLRETYVKHLLKAMVLSTLLFSMGMATPGIAKKMGFFQEEPPEEKDTVKVELSEPPRLKPAEPPPPPPPEVKIEAPSVRYMEIKAAEEKDVTEAPPPIPTDDKPIGSENKGGDPNAVPPPFDPGPAATPVAPDVPLLVVQQKPAFKGSLQDYIDENMVYPDEDKAYNNEGTTDLTFVVDVNGNVSDIVVTKSSDSKTLDAEAIRLIRKSSGMWHPAKNQGKIVKAYCKTSITFVLNEEE